MSDVEQKVLDALKWAFEEKRRLTVTITHGDYMMLCRLIYADEQELDRLRADNERLRALVKESEWVPGFCPWCHSGDAKHSNCRAFNPDGTVR